MDTCPKNYTKPVFRQEIDLKKYDFSKVAIKLLGSVNGRYSGPDLFKYGQKRLEQISTNAKF